MDFDDFYQQNKRFLWMVGSGFILFIIGQLIVESMYGIVQPSLKFATGQNSETPSWLIARTEGSQRTGPLSSFFTSSPSPGLNILFIVFFRCCPGAFSGSRHDYIASP